jgi:hypothetical protein
MVLLRPTCMAPFGNEMRRRRPNWLCVEVQLRDRVGSAVKCQANDTRTGHKVEMHRPARLKSAFSGHEAAGVATDPTRYLRRRLMSTRMHLARTGRAWLREVTLEIWVVLLGRPKRLDCGGPARLRLPRLTAARPMVTFCECHLDRWMPWIRLPLASASNPRWMAFNCDLGPRIR